jgi:hypothetical protein
LLKVGQPRGPGNDEACGAARADRRRRILGEPPRRGVRVQLREFEGAALVDVRKHYTGADGKLQPTKKGLSLAIRRLPELAAAINKALAKAKQLGLVDDEVAS